MKILLLATSVFKMFVRFWYGWQELKPDEEVNISSYIYDCRQHTRMNVPNLWNKENSFIDKDELLLQDCEHILFLFYLIWKLFRTFFKDQESKGEPHRSKHYEYCLLGCVPSGKNLPALWRNMLYKFLGYKDKVHTCPPRASFGMLHASLPPHPISIYCKYKHTAAMFNTLHRARN